MTTWLLLLGVALNAAGALTARAKRALTGSGAASAFVVGFAIYFGLGVQGWVVLMTFFVTSTALSRVESAAKLRAAAMHDKGASRDAVQVLANGGVPAAAALVYAFTGEAAALTAVVASVAAANADTWAGEVGMLSSRRPRSIVTFRPVETGRSGGVTPLGTAGAAAGSLAIGLVSWGLSWNWDADGVLFLLAVVSGFSAAILDSVLGSTVQARYIDPAGLVTEKPSPGATLAGGIRWFTNDAVNAVSGASAAALAAILAAAVG